MKRAHIVRGRVEADGSIVLDEQVTLPPGPVQVTIMPQADETPRPATYTPERHTELIARLASIAAFGQDAPSPFRSATEIMLAMTEEVGEVATEVALLEQVGTKAQWSKEPSGARLAEELTHVLNIIFALANFAEIDLERVYREKINP